VSRSSEGEDNHNPKYNSQELDKETGYYFYNARHYDPEISRFVTADNVIDGEGDTQGWNRYSYVKGNPIVYKDPTGHKIVLESVGMHLFEGTSPSDNISREDIKANDVFVYEEQWYHRNPITNFFCGDKKYLGKLKAREYEGDEMNPPETILYVENDKGESTGDFENIVLKDKNKEIMIAGSNLLVDTVSDVSLLSAFKKSKNLKDASKILLQKSIDPIDAKNIEKGKSLFDSLLDSLPIAGPKRSLDNLFDAGKNNIVNKNLADEMKKKSE